MNSYIFLNLLFYTILARVWLNTPIVWFLVAISAVVIFKLTLISSHTLLTLLIMEFLMLLLLTLLMLVKESVFSSSNFVLTFFTLATCEASLGLGLLIYLSRNFGSQLLASTFFFKLTKLLAFKAANTPCKTKLSMTITLNFQLKNQ